MLVAHKVVEDHEVRQQDLVHPPDRLKAMQIVLGRLALDVARLVGEKRAGRMDALTARLEHRRHRMLRQPVDLQIGMQLAQLVRDRRIPLRVPSPIGDETYNARLRRDLPRTQRRGGAGGATKSRNNKLTFTGSRR